MPKGVPFDISPKSKNSTGFKPLKAENRKKVLQNRLLGGKIR